MRRISTATPHRGNTGAVELLAGCAKHDGGMTRPITIAAIVAIAAVALTVAARAADDKPLGPHSYIIFCGIVPGTCTWVGETQPVVPVPRPRPRMQIPATETGKG